MIFGDMKSPEILDYQRVEKALYFIMHHSSEQPSLETISEYLGMSPFHFQKLFSRWAGISPKRFFKVITSENAKVALRKSLPTLEAAWGSGLSGTGRLYDLLVTVEAAAPGEIASGGDGLILTWGVADSPFGYCFVAMSDRGICRLEFHDTHLAEGGIERLRRDWPAAELRRGERRIHLISRSIFDSARPYSGVPPSAGASPEGIQPIQLMVRGTNFQIQVWKALLAIPSGSLATYGSLAKAVGNRRGARSVGGAVGRNPIAYLIPCHRVIRSIGESGGYRWGSLRKQALLSKELEIG